jgi:hypothetical protein
VAAVWLDELEVAYSGNAARSAAAAHLPALRLGRAGAVRVIPPQRFRPVPALADSSWVWGQTCFWSTARLTCHRRLSGGFWLRQAPIGRPLSPMAHIGQKGPSGVAANAVPWSLSAAPRRLLASRVTEAPDSLHCRSDASDSAVQFNRSVSAMPSRTSGKFGRLPRQGTADTLLLRSMGSL